MSNNKNEESENDIHSLLLTKLNEELKKKNIHLDIYTVGGFALKHHNLKGETYDIDAFYVSNDDIEKAITDVEPEELKGVLHNGEHWLNKAVDYVNDTNVMNPGETNSSLEYSFSNLKVYVAKIGYLLVMKIIAYNDKHDAKHLKDILVIFSVYSYYKSKDKILSLFHKFNINPEYYEKTIDSIIGDS